MKDKKEKPAATMTVEEAAALLGISRMSAYAGCARGEIPSLRIGKRLIVPRIALEKLLADPNAPRAEG